MDVEVISLEHLHSDIKKITRSKNNKLMNGFPRLSFLSYVCVMDIYLRTWETQFRWHCLTLGQHHQRHFYAYKNYDLSSIVNLAPMQSADIISDDVISNIPDRCNLRYWLISQPPWQLNVISLFSYYCHAFVI